MLSSDCDIHRMSNLSIRSPDLSRLAYWLGRQLIRQKDRKQMSFGLLLHAVTLHITQIDNHDCTNIFCRKRQLQIQKSLMTVGRMLLAHISSLFSITESDCVSSATHSGHLFTVHERYGQVLHAFIRHMFKGIYLSARHQSQIFTQFLP